MQTVSERPNHDANNPLIEALCDDCMTDIRTGSNIPALDGPLYFPALVVLYVQIEQFTTPTLKEFLRSRCLSVAGGKADIVNRVKWSLIDGS